MARRGCVACVLGASSRRARATAPPPLPAALSVPRVRVSGRARRRCSGRRAPSRSTAGWRYLQNDDLAQRRARVRGGAQADRRRSIRRRPGTATWRWRAAITTAPLSGVRRGAARRAAVRAGARRPRPDAARARSATPRRSRRSRPRWPPTPRWPTCAAASRCCGSAACRTSIEAARAAAAAGRLRRGARRLRARAAGVARQRVPAPRARPARAAGRATPMRRSTTSGARPSSTQATRVSLVQIGELLEEQQDFAGAEAAYRKAADDRAERRAGRADRRGGGEGARGAAAGGVPRDSSRRADHARRPGGAHRRPARAAAARGAAAPGRGHRHRADTGPRRGSRRSRAPASSSRSRTTRSSRARRCAAATWPPRSAGSWRCLRPTGPTLRARIAERPRDRRHGAGAPELSGRVGGRRVRRDAAARRRPLRGGARRVAAPKRSSVDRPPARARRRCRAESPWAHLTLANQLTILRIMLIPAFVLLRGLRLPGRGAGRRSWSPGLTDALDGLIARRAGQRTSLGAWLDPMADKLLLVTTFIVLTLPGHPADQPPAAVADGPRHQPRRRHRRRRGDRQPRRSARARSGRRSGARWPPRPSS